MGKTTLTVQEETLERFNDAKATPEDIVEPSADAFLNGLLDGVDGDGADFTATASIHPTLDEEATAALIDDLRDELSMVADPGAVFDDDAVSQLMDRLDELERQLPERTADELEGRFR